MTPWPIYVVVVSVFIVVAIPAIAGTNDGRDAVVDVREIEALIGG